MHNVWVRLNAITFYALSVLLGLSVLAAISKIGHSSRNAPGMYIMPIDTLLVTVLWLNFFSFNALFVSRKSM